MNPLKFSLGPYDLFGAIISGLPILFGIDLIYYQWNLGEILRSVAELDLQHLLVGVILSYLLGSMMSGLTWFYFHRVCHLFKKHYDDAEGRLLSKMKDLEGEMSPEEFEKASFKERLAYMVKRRICDTEINGVNNRLLPLLRQEAPAIAANADQFMALKIMFRNLSFGLLVLFAMLTGYGVTEAVIDMDGQGFFLHLLIGLVCLGLSILAFSRALTFRGFWGRQVLVGFYQVSLDKYLEK